jgi:ABC-2 type transport system permease protein
MTTETTTTTTAGPAGTPTPQHQIVRVHVPKRSLGSEVRAIKIVWRRELIRFFGDKLRIVTALVQPFLFLFVLGSGLQHVAAGGTYGVNFKTFIYPGILCIAVMFTAMFSTASIVWDREFGFLREMMVAPIRRSSIVVGKVFGAATVASFQGLIVLAIAPLVHVPYAPTLLISVFAIQLLLAFSIASFGAMVAVRIKQMQSFMAVMQMIITPMYFISGAMFPPSGLPTWLTILNRIDPIAYAVDPIRRIVFNHISMTPSARKALDSGITWWGWRVPTLLEVAMVLVLGLIMLGIAIWEFSSTE